MDTTRFPLWSTEEDARLRQMAAGGRTKHEIATALGRTVNAVAARAMAIRVRFRAHQESAAEALCLRRRCLRCRNFFDVPHRFRFVCDLCHALEEWRGADLG
jgi:hypothetical protein